MKNITSDKLADNKDLMAVVLNAANSEGAAGPKNPALDTVIALLANRLAREEAEEQQKRDLKRASDRQIAEDMQRAYQINVLDPQKNCSHRKENNQPNTGAQRDHKGREIVICQSCMKTWVGQECPPDLRPHPSKIGGPLW